MQAGEFEKGPPPNGDAQYTRLRTASSNAQKRKPPQGAERPRRSKASIKKGCKGVGLHGAVPTAVAIQSSCTRV